MTALARSGPPRPPPFHPRPLDRGARRRDLPPRSPAQRRDVSLLDARARLRRPLRVREVEPAQLRRVARVALRDDAVDGAREAAHRARAARIAGDLRRVRGWAALVFEGPRAHARRGCGERGSTARVRARRDRGASRGALPADPQRRAGVDGRRAPRLGAALADREPQSGTWHAHDPRRAAGRGRRESSRTRSTTPSRPGTSRPASSSRQIVSSRATAGERSRPMRSSRLQRLSRGRANAGTAAGSVADHCQVVLHVDAAALRGGAGRSDLPLETIKRLTCDGSLITIVEDEHGTPLDVGRKQRTVSTSLRRALWSRDRGCTFPGCRNKRFVAGPSHPSLGQRRRDEPREPHAALHPSPPPAARGRVQYRPRSGTARSTSGAPTGA